MPFVAKAATWVRIPPSPLKRKNSWVLCRESCGWYLAFFLA